MLSVSGSIEANVQIRPVVNSNLLNHAADIPIQGGQLPFNVEYLNAAMQQNYQNSKIVTTSKPRVTPTTPTRKVVKTRNHVTVQPKLNVTIKPIKKKESTGRVNRIQDLKPQQINLTLSSKQNQYSSPILLNRKNLNNGTKVVIFQNNQKTSNQLSIKISPTNMNLSKNTTFSKQISHLKTNDTKASGLFNRNASLALLMLANKESDSSEWIYDSVESDYSEYFSDNSDEVKSPLNKNNIYSDESSVEFSDEYYLPGEKIQNRKKSSSHNFIDSDEGDFDVSEEMRFASRPGGLMFLSKVKSLKNKVYSAENNKLNNEYEYYDDSEDYDYSAEVSESWEDIDSVANRSPQRGKNRKILDFRKPFKSLNLSPISRRKKNRDEDVWDYYSSEDSSYEYEYEYSDSENNVRQGRNNIKTISGVRNGARGNRGKFVKSQIYRRNRKIIDAYYDNSEDKWENSDEGFWYDSDDSEGVDKRGLMSKTLADNFGGISDDSWEKTERDSYEFDSSEDKSDKGRSISRIEKRRRKSNLESWEDDSDFFSSEDFFYEKL